MSDDDNALNTGSTLPEGTDATYNGGLSPLFIDRGGYINPWSRMIDGNGSSSILWSFIASSIKGSYYSQIAKDVSHLSFSWDQDRASGYSLRCLVSTTNS